MADTNGPDDAELEAMMRHLKPNRARTALVAGAAIASIFGLLALLATLTISELPSTPTAHRATAPDGGVDPDAGIENDDAGLVVITDQGDLDDLSAPVRAVANQTVTISAETPDGRGQMYGTGFIVSDGLVISAAHILAHASGEATYPVHVHCHDRSVEGGVIAYDAVRDVMAVFAPGCNGTDLAYDVHRLRVDDTLHVAGFMFLPAVNIAYRFHRNTSPVPTARLHLADVQVEPDLVAHMNEMRRLRVARFQAIAGAAIPGNSGSPVFGDDGRIVGMLVIRDTLHDRSYIVPARTILHVLRANGLP